MFTLILPALQFLILLALQVTDDRAFFFIFGVVVAKKRIDFVVVAVHIANAHRVTAMRQLVRTYVPCAVRDRSELVPKPTGLSGSEWCIEKPEQSKAQRARALAMHCARL